MKNSNQIEASGTHIFIGNMKSSLFLAFKSVVKGNKWALTLLILVMAFSFVNLIFVSSLISGIMITLDNQMISYVYGDVVISPKTEKYYIEKSSKLENSINQVSGVAAVTSRLDYSAFIEYLWKDKISTTDRGRSGTWEVVGIEPDTETQVTIINKRIIAGKFLESNDRDNIVLGIEIAGGPQASSADFLTLGGASVGNKVRLTYPNGIQREYTIKGIVYAREMNRTDRIALVSRDEMVSVLGRDAYYDRASQILVKSEKGVDENSLIQDINAIGMSEQIKSWREYGGSASSIVSTFEVIGSLIGSVGLIVSATVMFIIIYINVLNKKRQIGILRAIGIPNIAIIGSYIFQAFFFAVMGTIVGWILINFVLQPYFQFYPLELAIGMVSLNIRTVTVISSALGLTAAGVLAGWIPSQTIMRQSIISIVWGN